MSKHMYKQYMRILKRWPKDAYKNPERDPVIFLEKEIDRQFMKEPQVLPLDAAVCERRYQALEQIVSNDISRMYPHNYSSGVFGLKLEQLQEGSSDENRRHFGLAPKVGFFKKVWRTVVPEKNPTS